MPAPVTHDRSGVGDDRHIGAGVVGNLQPAFDDAHGPGAVRQNGEDSLLIDPIRVGHANRDLYLHRVDRQSDSISNTERVVPEGVPQCTHRRFRIIRPADIGPHADLQHHALQSHFRLASTFPSFRGMGAAREPGIHEHELALSWDGPVFMASGPAPLGHPGMTKSQRGALTFI